MLPGILIACSLMLTASVSPSLLDTVFSCYFVFRSCCGCISILLFFRDSLFPTFCLVTSRLNIKPIIHDTMAQNAALIAFNQRADPELNRERQALANAYERSVRDGRRLDCFSPVARAILTQAVQHSTYSNPGLKTCIETPTSAKASVHDGDRILRGALFAAAGALVIGLGNVVAASEQDRLQAWRALVGDVCLAASAGGLGVAMVDTIRKSLEVHGPALLQTISQMGPAVCLSAAVAGSFTAAIGLVKTFWCTLQAALAWMCSDIRAQAEEMAKAKAHFSLDNLCRAVAAAVSAAAIAIAPLPVAGFVSVLLPTILTCIALSLTDYVLRRKNANSGWLNYVRTFFQQDQRRKCWAGQLFDQQEGHITMELQCNISLSTV